jgi:hypothetical protein
MANGKWCRVILSRYDSIDSEEDFNEIDDAYQTGKCSENGCRLRFYLALITSEEED